MLDTNRLDCFVMEILRQKTKQSFLKICTDSLYKVYPLIAVRQTYIFKSSEYI